eukprot:maker-scaffold203_size261420-snap-gene-1.24 protein:Tk10417 transcript:maker-scaffold203_size261420-snap-gene-1.24-mRNA-1 annotation:"glucose-6-phosphate 1-dehydrogenase"
MRLGSLPGFGLMVDLSSKTSSASSLTITTWSLNGQVPYNPRSNRRTPAQRAARVARHSTPGWHLPFHRIPGTTTERTIARTQPQCGGLPGPALTRVLWRSTSGPDQRTKHWNQKGRIVKKVSNRIYEIKMDSGAVFCRNWRFIRTILENRDGHGDSLGEVDEDDEDTVEPVLRARPLRKDTRHPRPRLRIREFADLIGPTQAGFHLSWERSWPFKSSVFF